MKHPTIQHIHAREILDSRGAPTVEVTVRLSDGTEALASVPSGASTGTYEAWELRDADPRRYNGKGVLKACQNVEEHIAPALKGKAINHMQSIDTVMRETDGTENLSHLGANAVLGVSLACARAGAIASQTPLYRYIRETYELGFSDYVLPRPMVNILNGGRHADNGLDIQEYMIIPKGKSFGERIRIAAEIMQSLAGVLRSQKLSTLVGDEGGFAPRMTSNTDPLKHIVMGIERTDYALGADVELGLDAAASEFYLADDKKYLLRLEAERVTADELLAWYADLFSSFPIHSLEDGLSEDDWEGWKTMTKNMGGDRMIVGDDLFVTNKKRFERGINEKAANCILIKPNQIGTLSDTIATIKMAIESGYRYIISHRSGETTDSFIADLSVAVNAPYIKAGSVTRGERLAKYNRLLAIEEALQ